MFVVVSYLVFFFFGDALVMSGISVFLGLNAPWRLDFLLIVGIFGTGM